MVKKISDGVVMDYYRISEVYPDDYILTEEVEVDYSKGIEKGTVLYTSESDSELLDLMVEKGLLGKGLIVEGNNLHPLIAGLYFL